MQLRRCLFMSVFCAIIAAAPLVAGVRVVISDLKPLGTMNTMEASMISEMLRNEIARLPDFEVVESKRVNALLAEATFTHSEETEDRSSEFASLSTHVTHAIRGTVGIFFEHIIITTEIIEIATGRVLFAKECMTGKERIFDDTKSFAQSLGYEILEASFGVSIENIDKLISLGRYDEAYAMLHHYREAHGESDDVAMREHAIHQGIVAILHRQIEESFEDENIPRVEELLDRAITYNASIEAAKETVARVDTIRKTRRDEDEEKATDAVISAYRKKQYIRSLVILSNYLAGIDPLTKTARVYETERTVLRGIGTYHYTRGKTLYARDAYEKAAAEVMTAMSIAHFDIPHVKRCVKLIERIERKKERKEKKVAIKEALPSPLSDAKRKAYYLSLAPTITFFANTPVLLRLTGGFRGAEATFGTYAEILPPLNIFYRMEGAFTTGKSKNVFDANISHETDFLSITAGGAAGPAVCFRGIEFALLGEVTLGGLYRNVATYAFGAVNTNTQFSLSLNTAFIIRMAWYITDAFGIVGEYRVGHAFALGAPHYTFFGVSLGTSIGF